MARPPLLGKEGNALDSNSFTASDALGLTPEARTGWSIISYVSRCRAHASRLIVCGTPHTSSPDPARFSSYPFSVFSRFEDSSRLPHDRRRTPNQRNARPGRLPGSTWMGHSLSRSPREWRRAQPAESRRCDKGARHLQIAGGTGPLLPVIDSRDPEPRCALF